MKIPLYGIDETVTRPGLVCVYREIFTIIGISPDIYTQISDDDNIVKKINKLGELRGNNNSKQEWVSITFEEETEEGKELSTIPINPEYKPIWEDNDINALCKVMHISRKLKIKFKYYNISKSGSLALANRLRLLPNNDNGNNIHSMEYYYHVGHYMTELVKTIHNLKNLREEIPITYKSYLENTFDSRADTALTYDGNLDKAEIVIRETQESIVGYFTDELSNITPEYDDEHKQWYIEFNYDVIYDKPAMLLVTYPLIVYNTLIDKKFRLVNNVKKKHPYSNFGRSLYYTDKVVDPEKTLKPFGHNNFISVPKNDKPKLFDTFTFVSRLFTVLTILEPDNLNFLFNINDIPGIKFKDKIRDFIIKEGNNVGTLQDSLIYIELYENNYPTSDIKVIVNENGDLVTDKPMDIKKLYRVVFNVLTGTEYINPKSRKRIEDLILIDAIDNAKPINESLYYMFLNIYTVNTPYPDKHIIYKYGKEDIGYNILERLKDITRTVAVNEIIIRPEYILEEK